MQEPGEESFKKDRCATRSNVPGEHSHSLGVTARRVRLASAISGGIVG